MAFKGKKNMNTVAVENEIMHRGQSDPDLQKISKQLTDVPFKVQIISKYFNSPEPKKIF